MIPSIAICWLRRDLRLDDNAALSAALEAGDPVLPLFIFDTDILDKLSDKADKRVQFIHQQLELMNATLVGYGSTMIVKVGQPQEVWKQLINDYHIKSVYTNHDFEPYAIKRDEEISKLLAAQSIPLHTFKDHVIFEKAEVTKDDGLPYTVFTPYSKKWRARLTASDYAPYESKSLSHSYYQAAKPYDIPSLESFGFSASEFHYPAKVVKADIINHYSERRDFPAVEGTSHLGLHLRFGTLSVRMLMGYAIDKNFTFVNELIWRDFYQQILWHFPHVVDGGFRKEYDQIEWVNNQAHFEAWCAGLTGYPLVDAGMRELNATGYMHNRVRMVVASFLTKHLLIDWRWGEAYFAQKLLDFDLAANNGGWQWAAGSGTDAAPYFRIFSPAAQFAKFDPQAIYVKQWVPEYGTSSYPQPIVNHEEARIKCLEVYKRALKRE